MEIQTRINHEFTRIYTNPNGSAGTRFVLLGVHSWLIFSFRLRLCLLHRGRDLAFQVPGLGGIRGEGGQAAAGEDEEQGHAAEQAAGSSGWILHGSRKQHDGPVDV